MKKLLLLLGLTVLCQLGFAQKGPKLKVFLDCSQTWICNTEFVRSEVHSVDFVRDRFDADVHVLVNHQNASSGGTQIRLNFIGQRNFQALQDTVTYFNDPTVTEDEGRRRMVRYLELGLTQYLLKTSYADQLEVRWTGQSTADSSQQKAVKDPWNFWVFQFGGNMSFDGSQNYKTSNFGGWFSADRETEAWKINYSFNASRTQQTFIQDNQKSKFSRQDFSSELQVARSINKHWSYGISATYLNSLFSNIRTGLRFRPKLEYSVLPYSKFNTERIVVQYMAGPTYNDYYDSTIYFKEKETLVQQNVNLIASFTKPWGSINMGVFYSNYFDDFKKNSISFNGGVSWRIVKGLNFAVWGFYGLVNDQISLRKVEASRDELLIKNRELRSSFQYSMNVGFSYRFGSIHNSIVNPRFKGLSYSINY